MTYWMRLGTWVGGTMLALVAVAWLIGALLPRTWTAEATVRIAAPPEAVRRELADLPHWPLWSVWNRRHLNGLNVRPAGPGRVMWESREMGRVEVSQVPDQGGAGVPPDATGQSHFSYRLRFADHDLDVEGRFEWEPEAGGAATRLRWRQQGQLAHHPLARWTGLLLIRWFARADMRESLASLKERLER